MRNLLCPTCGGNDKEVIYRATIPDNFDEARPSNPYSAHYAINRCIGCGLVHSSPIMEEAGVTALYEQGSETNVESGEEDNVRRTMAGYYRLAAPHLSGRKRILDVGCDMGFLLQVAREDGFQEIQGLEPVPIARAMAEKVPGAHIGSELFADVSFPKSYFDLITFVHVIDHLSDPNEALIKALGLLQPGGIILAVVHNVDCFIGLITKERFPIFNLYHHFFFGKQTLANLFESKGYEILEVVNTYNCYSLAFFIRRFPGLPKHLKVMLSWVLSACGLGRIPLPLPVGNIGIVARRPFDHKTSR